MRFKIHNLSVTLLVAIPLSLVLYFWGYIPVKGIYVRWQVGKTDKKLLLSDCREMLARRNEYKDMFGKGYVSDGEIGLDTDNGGITTNVPVSIRNLNPRAIRIGTNRVIIYLRAPRAKVIGFAEGAREYGTEKLTNGLWYVSH